MNTQNIPAPVPVIEVKKIDKILKKDAKAGKLMARALVVLNVNADPSSNTCENVGRCAIGALLLEAGVSLKKIKENNGTETIPGSPFAQLLEREYGILPLHVEVIEGVNDSVSCPPSSQLDRYEEVMGVIAFADVAQSQGVRFQDSYSLRKTYYEGIID